MAHHKNGMREDDAYEQALLGLQLGLVRTQQWAIETGAKLIVVFEGRDAAGKDGAIKRITEYLSPRATRVAALPKPSDRERTQWFFQRYAAHLPAAGEIVLFNRSWYNRAGVEPVMGFCTPQEHEAFLADVTGFERMLIDSGAVIVKLWLDISRKEQAQRLKERRSDPLKALKISPLDAEAQKRWDAYSAARDTMLTRTHTAATPWMVVRADDKKAARLAIIAHILHIAGAPGVAASTPAPDPAILFAFETAALSDGRLAR
jgi:polyphosphate kinase 2